MKHVSGSGKVLCVIKRTFKSFSKEYLRNEERWLQPWFAEAREKRGDLKIVRMPEPASGEFWVDHLKKQRKSGLLQLLRAMRVGVFTDKNTASELRKGCEDALKDKGLWFPDESDATVDPADDDASEDTDE